MSRGSTSFKHASPKVEQGKCSSNSESVDSVALPKGSTKKFLVDGVIRYEQSGR
jgi:hypothetical protein